MSQVAEQPVKDSQVKAIAPVNAVKQAIAETLHADEQRIAALEAEVIKLRANQKTDEKKPVDDAALDKAIVVLESKNKADVSKLDLSLSKQLGFTPLFSAIQKKDWQKRRDAMRAAHSAYWKANAGIAIAHLRRATRSKTALMGGAIKNNKEGKVNSVVLRANKLAPKVAAKGKGANAAKPAQIAAKVPKAGNAVNPATVS
jgi:hypothetical protein